MKRVLFSVLCVFILSWNAFAIERDTTNTPKLDYGDELGFFQKANRELTDPRFMFRDDKTGVEFGIGGTAQVAAEYTFAGSLVNYDFNPAYILVPHTTASQFLLKVHGSEVHFKSRAHIKGHKILAFVKIGADLNYNIKLKQAYLSFDGFSLGMIPSFFNDMEYGVMSQVNTNTQIDVTQPLVGYTFKRNGWEIAAALEKADFDLSKYDFKDLDAHFQSVPDITFHVKKRWEKGHIQLGGVYRKLEYWSRTDIEAAELRGKTFYTNGYGISLSGNYKPTNKLKFSAAAVAGKGIEKYMGIYAGSCTEVARTDKIVEEHFTVESIPAFSVAFATQYNWTDELSSSVIASYAQLYRNKYYEYTESHKNAFHAEANLYWNISGYGYMGLAYFYGINTIVPDYINQQQMSGHANRLMFIIAYLF